MALYEYKALGKGKNRWRGFLDADSLENAKEKLHARSIFFLSVKKYHSHRKGQAIFGGKLFVIHFTRELAELLRSGLPLYETLVTLQEKYQKKKEAAIILDFCDHVKEGKYLSDGMKKYESLFDPIYIAMVQSAEASGTLDVVFFELSLILEKNYAIERQIKNALIYPGFLFSFAMILVIGLFYYLIPSMKELFEGRQVHPLTATIMKMSDWLMNNSVFFFTTLALTAILLILVLRHPFIKNHGKNLLLKIPLCKKIIVEAVMMRFSRTFSLLLKSGIVALEALRLSKKVAKFSAFEEIFHRVEEGLMEGRAMSEGFKKEALIPPLFTRMLATGEKTGATADMLMHVAKMYEDNLNKSIAQFLQFLQPALLIVLATIVGTIILSILLPLTDISTLS